MNSVVIPWPDSVYLPNNFIKLNRYVANRLTRKAREECFWEAKNQGLPIFPAKQKLNVLYEFTPPMRSGSPPDETNMLHMLKAHQDGVADAIKVDDRYWKLEKPIIHERKGKGEIKITFNTEGNEHG